MTNKLQGTGVALVTPFTRSGEVDYKGLKNLIDHVLAGGVEYLVSLGTTGESATLNEDEKNKILDITIEHTAGRVPIIAGFGGNDTRQIIAAIGARDMTGIGGILSVSPYYNKPTQQGIYEHYKAISQSTEMPLIMYNVPGRTSSNISADTCLRLANDFSNVIAIKEASGDLVQCMKIVSQKPENFLVISGEDALTLPMISFGMDGVISVIANAYPRQYSDMVRLSLNGRFAEATKIQMALLPLIEYIFADGNPAGIKCVLAQMQICQENLRLPLVNVSTATRDNIRMAMQSLA